MFIKLNICLIILYAIIYSQLNKIFANTYRFKILQSEHGTDTFRIRIQILSPGFALVSGQIVGTDGSIDVCINFII